MKPVSPYKHVYFKRLKVTKTVLAVIFIEKHAKKRTRFRNTDFFIYLSDDLRRRFNTTHDHLQLMIYVVACIKLKYFILLCLIE